MTIEFRRAFVGAIALSVVALGSIGPSALRAQAAPICSTERSSNGELSFSGAPSAELEQAANFVEQFNDQSDRGVVGSRFCTDYSGLEVFVGPKVDDSVLRAISTYRTTHSNLGVEVVHVDRSPGDLRGEIQAILLSDPSGSVYQSLEPDISTGLIRARIAVNGVHKSATPASVVVEPVSYSGGEHSSRNSDVSPYKAGAKISADGYICSLGPRVHNGSHIMILTAGHCPGVKHFTGDDEREVGVQYTNAYANDASRFGDWKLLTGYSYGTSYFNGAAGSSSTYPGAGINWGTRTIGSKVCSSGAVGGQICHFHVSSVNESVFMEGKWVGHQTQVISDNMATSNPADCDGWVGGDSGGPIVHNNGSGAVVYDGLVQGVTWWYAGSQKRCHYWYTQMGAVRAWAPGATW